MPGLIVAVIRWQQSDEISKAICTELADLGYQPSVFDHNTMPPSNAQVVFSFGPYGNFLNIPAQLARASLEQRPIFVHWNTEGIPDLRIPWRFMRWASGIRSWLGRIDRFDHGRTFALIHKPPLSQLNQRMLRFRNVGDYNYAYRNGWLNVLADSSIIYADVRTQMGLPTLYAPWGYVPQWSGNLRCARDIDVLWMGNRATRRRSQILDAVCQQLDARGVRVYRADNEHAPFIFGEERMRLLNRAKITLNVTRTWYDDNYSRLAIAAPNRSLIVSETLLPHCPNWVAGKHYVASPVNLLADTILDYLDHDAERERIVENAYQFVTTELTFGSTVRTIMDSVCAARRRALSDCAAR